MFYVPKYARKKNLIVNESGRIYVFLNIILFIHNNEMCVKAAIKLG